MGANDGWVDYTATYGKERKQFKIDIEPYDPAQRKPEGKINVSIQSQNGYGFHYVDTYKSQDNADAEVHISGLYKQLKHRYSEIAPNEFDAMFKKEVGAL